MIRMTLTAILATSALAALMFGALPRLDASLAKQAVERQETTAGHQWRTASREQ